MDELHIDQYGSEKELFYGGERYIVRDNGAVYRKYASSRRRSRIDEKWTFGRREQRSGYMFIGPHPIHRIVAFAFIGEPPSEQHVVDHIDAVPSNNCVENLRWITKLENVLRHPRTRQVIVNAYGSLEQFVENPRASTRLDKSMEWLATVSSEYAKNSLERVLSWAKSDGRPEGNGMFSRIYGVRKEIGPIERKIPDKQSLTATAVQRGWKTPTEFPNCPVVIGPNPLAEYAGNLQPGAIFAKDKYKSSTVVEATHSDLILSVLVKIGGDNPIKPWAVAKVTLEDGKFLHEGIGTFFELNGAKKDYYKLLDIPFVGESIDDYC